jgi:hypothetical protein
MHAAACAQAGAAAVTIPIAAVRVLFFISHTIDCSFRYKIRDWRRDRGSGVTYPDENTGEDSDDAIRDAQTIAAYFRQHGISSTQLLACNINHVRHPLISFLYISPLGLLRRQGTTNLYLQVDDACSLAALDALSFDADQARAAEWYDAYPIVQRTIPDSAVRRAASFFTPPPPLDDEDGDARVRASRAQRTLDRMDAEALSAFSAVVYAALGSDRAAMSLISDIAKREIDWQLALKRPMYYTILRPAPQSAAGADKIAQPRDRKRKKCRAPEVTTTTTLRVPDSETPSTTTPRKRYRLASGAYRRCIDTVSERSATPPPEGSRKNDEADEGEGEGWEEGGDSDAPAGRLWQRLAIGRRDLPPPTSERIEEESSTATLHTCEQVPEFNGSPVGVPVSGRVMGLAGEAPRRAATGGRTPPPRDSDLGGASSNHWLERASLIEPGHP